MRAGSRTKKLVALLVLVGVLFVGWSHAQAIQDWLRLRGYHPPAAISALVAEDTMTAESQHIFYVNHPKMYTDVNSFRQDCSETEQTIVLGCYHPKQNGIAVYDVKDQRLHGVVEVTAAHEMLHAAYDRLSSKERDRIDGLLQDYYKNHLTDQRILSTINAYKKTEPNDVVNEMHSVFGTEVANLPQPLEDYYKQYFANRSVVVAFAQSYEGEFTTRVAQIDADDQKLADVKTKIAQEEQLLSAQLDQINADRQQLESLRSNGQIAQYNAKVEDFNAEVDAYNAGVQKLQADIADYNDLVTARNSLASELRALDQSLDTRLTTQAAQ